MRRIAPSRNSPMSATSIDVPCPRHRHDHVGLGDRGLARRHRESVEECLESQHRIDLDHRDKCPCGSEVLRHAAPAGSVAEHRDPLAVGAAIRDPDERLEDALPDGVLVLGELLDGAVVDDEDRAGQPLAQRARAVPVQTLSPPCRRGATGRDRRASGEEVAAVVEDQIWPGVDDLTQEAVVLGGFGGRTVRPPGCRGPGGTRRPPAASS